MRFTGSIYAKMDEKGRVFVPSAFRKILRRDGEEDLVLRRDIFVDCLKLYPKSVWDGLVDAVRANTNPFDRRQQQALRLFAADAEYITLDSGGRMLIPRRDMEYAHITNDVRFVGVDDSIEIWDKETAEAYFNNPKETGDLLEEIMRPPVPLKGE